MRFWITRNSELSIREQLVRQIMLGILSQDLPPGHKLPSTRALARLHHIHSNTVSAAYHDLLAQGWLELRRGSGLYVRALQSSGANSEDLDALLTSTLRSARSQGYAPDEVLRRLEQLILPHDYTRILIIEPDPGMREILQAEVGDSLPVPVEAVDPSDLANIATFSGRLVAALTTRAITVRQMLPRGVSCTTLRLRSVRGSLEGQTAPAPNTIISIFSKSSEFRYWARAILIAVGLDPECLCEVDTRPANWQDRITAGALIVTDVVTARSLPADCQSKVFRVVADSSLAEIKTLCRV